MNILFSLSRRCDFFSELLFTFHTGETINSMIIGLSCLSNKKRLFYFLLRLHFYFSFVILVNRKKKSYFTIHQQFNAFSIANSFSLCLSMQPFLFCTYFHDVSFSVAENVGCNGIFLSHHTIGKSALHLPYNGDVILA